MIIENRNRRKNRFFDKVYYLWYNMKRRCLNENNKDYKYYGAKGVEICERWLNLEFFIEDLDKIKGFDKELFENGLLTLDKDGVNMKGKLYSLETCEFISKSENNKRKPSIQKTFECFDNNNSIGIFTNQSELSKIIGISQSTISYCLKHGKKSKNRYSFKFID